MRFWFGVSALTAIATVAVAVLVAGSRDTGVVLDPDLVAVAALVNETGDATLEPLGRMAAERIAQGIQQQAVAEVVPPVVALGAAAELRDVPDRVGAFAAATNAGVVLHGAYYLLADSLQFQLQITDAGVGEVLIALAPVTAPRASAGQALGVVRERVVAGLAAALDMRAGILPFPVQPPSVEVYRPFRRAIVDDTPFQDVQLRLYQEAWAMDSTFHPALVMIAKELRWLERDAESDSVSRIVDDYRDHMSEAERLYSQLYRGADPDAHLPAVRRLAELVPYYWSFFAAWAAWRAQRPAEALEYFARVDTTGPSVTPSRKLFYWIGIGRAYHMLEQYDEELKTLRAARREFPDDLRLVDSHLRALAASGRIEEVNALLDTLFALPVRQVPGGVRAVDARALMGADQLRTHGHPDAASHVAQRTLDWIEGRPSEEARQLWRGAYYAYSRAECLYRLERWEEARALYEELLAESPESASYLGRLGSIAARLGDRDQARAISERLAVQRGGQLWRRANIAALLGERAEAVRLLYEGLTAQMDRGRWNDGNWGTYLERRHRDMDLESLRGYPPFEQLMRPRG